MKHKFAYILYIIGLATIFAGCSNDLDEPTSITNSKGLQINATQLAFGQQETDFVSTRAMVNSKYNTEFGAGEQIGVFGVDASGAIKFDNIRFRLAKTGLWEQVDANGNVVANTLTADEGVTFFAYYPYINPTEFASTIASAGYDINKMKPFTSPENLKSNYYTWVKADYKNNKDKEGFSYVHETNDYVMHDLLYTQVVTPQNGMLNFTFKHAMAMVEVYYNDNSANLSVQRPADLKFWHPSDPVTIYKEDGTVDHIEYTYRYLMVPDDEESDVSGRYVNVFGLINNKSTETDGNTTVETAVTDFWQARPALKENTVSVVAIAGNPTESYETAGVDMGFPSGTIWAKYNLGSREPQNINTSWYVSPAIDAAEGITNVTATEPLSKCREFDRGDYYTWGEMYTKYEKPALILDTNGNVTGTYSSISEDGKTKTGLAAGSKLGYYKNTYFDPGYTIAPISGNIAGTQYDIVRSQLWKGEWRLPNENEIKELVANCDITIAGYYYEDNYRYAPWVRETANQHRYNTEYYGTDNQRPIRYLVAIFKFTSRKNGAYIYFPGGTWTDWSIDMLAINSRDGNGKYQIRNEKDFSEMFVNGQHPFAANDGYQPAYGGMYYFASSASHQKNDCCSYMEIRLNRTATPMTPTIPYEANVRQDGLTQDGHRYTGMQIRPVYGGSNWTSDDTTPEAKAARAKGMKIRATNITVNP